MDEVEERRATLRERARFAALPLEPGARPNASSSSSSSSGSEDGSPVAFSAAGSVPSPRDWLGVTFLCRSYLRLVRGDGSPDREREPRTFFVTRCSGARGALLEGSGPCGNALYEEASSGAAAQLACDPCLTPASRPQDMVLSRYHGWEVQGEIERAFYVNQLAAGSYRCGPERLEDLAQGPMTVCDVQCSRCDAVIGWKFCRDDQSGENEPFVGRHVRTCSLCVSFLHPKVDPRERLPCAARFGVVVSSHAPDPKDVRYEELPGGLRHAQGSSLQEQWPDPDRLGFQH